MTGRAKKRIAGAAVAAFITVTGAVASAAALPQASGPADCPKVGDTCDDGTVYVGISPDSGGLMFSTPADIRGVWMWDQAMYWAERRLDMHGHDDWRLPSKAELDVLYENRGRGALKGTFDESGSETKPWKPGWYWSSSESKRLEFGFEWDGAEIVRFSDGRQSWISKDIYASVRPVRAEPRP